MAATATVAIDKPNMVLPLAASLNTRGIAGFTNAVTNQIDQVKINSIYEPVNNAMTGKMTLELSKRPGVADVGSSYGTSGQVAYIWDIAAGATSNAAANRWVFSTSGNDVRASDASTTTVIVTAAGYAPTFVDKTSISGVDTVVVQLRDASGNQTAWYSSAIGTFTQISTSVFANLAHQGKAEHINGYMFIATRNRVYGSDLNSVSAWSANSYLDRQAQQDIGTGLAKLGTQIISFGTATMEILRAAPNATGLALEFVGAKNYGLASTIVTGQTHYTATADGRLYWVGSNPSGVFAYNGQTVEKVSTLAIDKIIAERGYYYVSRIGWQGQRAITIGLDVPSATTQRALLFFPRWNDWFEWTSTVFIPWASPRLEGVVLGVGSSQQKLYAISTSSDNWLDASSSYTFTHQFKIPTNDNTRKALQMFGVVGDIASTTTTSNLGVQFSDDEGVTWSSVRNIDLTSNRQCIYRCGAYRDRLVRLTHTANLDCRMESAVARIG